jgi:hypothetical protein
MVGKAGQRRRRKGKAEEDRVRRIREGRMLMVALCALRWV